MSLKTRVISLLGGAAAALVAGFVMPSALANAAGADTGAHETRDGAVCLQYTGDSAPSFLWNSLYGSGFAPVPDYLVPSDPWAGLDFDPGEYVQGGGAGL